MLKPGLWPPNKTRPTESTAEFKVYQALATQLPKGWYAWHSLRIRVPGHSDAEADFVIVDPARGILVLEVKGGRIEERAGLWYSNGQQLKHSPREQANRFRHELLKLLQAKQIDPPPCGIATCFPDTPFSQGPSQADMPGCVLGEQDLNWLDKALPEVMTCALPSGYKPKGKWIQAIHDLWGEIWIPRMDFGLKARVQKEERIRLDSEQVSVLQGLMDNDSVLVEGAAGAGKTVLALAMAQRMAQSGKRVLMLCFTEPLACWLEKQAGAANLSIWAIKRCALDLLRQAGKQIVVQDTPQFWRDVSLEAAIDALPNLQLPWDAVVVDEGQDLIDNDWVLIEELSRNKPLWAFWDPDQAFWTDRKLREDLFKTRYRLQKKYRCPEAVEQLANIYRGGALDLPGLRQAIEQDAIAIRPCPGAGTVVERIAIEIDKLKGSGLDPADIAVLSLRGAAEPESIIHRTRFGTHSIVRAHDDEAPTNIVAETFLRFKGLERAAIIVTDVGLALDKPDFSKRMYIALTRALSTVRIIDTGEALHRDPILGAILR